MPLSGRGPSELSFQGFHIGALIVRIGFLKGVYKVSIVGFYAVGALINRIGFGGIIYFNSNQEPPKPTLIIKVPILGLLGRRTFGGV